MSSGGNVVGRAVRLIVQDGAYRLEVTCACGELFTLDVLLPYGTCERCGDDLDPDPSAVVILGSA